MTKNQTNIIHVLRDWQGQDPDGKGKKTNKLSRVVLILADKRNWSIGIERQGSQPVGEKFGALAGPIIVSGCRLYGLDSKEGLLSAWKTFAALTGIEAKPNLDSSINELCESFEKAFHTSLLVDTNPKIAEIAGLVIEEE